MASSRSLKVAPEAFEKVKGAFDRKGKSQAMLADGLGISRTTISKFFSGKSIDRGNFVSICQSLRVEVDDVRSKPKPPLREQLKVKMYEIGDLIDADASEEEIVEKEQEFKALKRKYKRSIRFNINDKILDQYRLKECLDSGGFASVWRAVDITQRKRVAVKVLHSYYASIPSYREDFLQSAEAIKTLNRLECPNVVEAIYVPSSKEMLLDFNPAIDSCYFVMDLIDGQNLYKAILDKEQHFSEESLFKVIDAVSNALVYSHKHGIIHKDIKPQNILIDMEGNGYLTDFNLVIMKSESEQVSSSSAIGTYIYSPPEVLGYEEVDQRGDIYSLGMTIIFGLYRNHLPPEALINPRNFIDKRVDCTPELKGVLLKAVEFSPERRYNSVEEFHISLFEAWKNRKHQLISVSIPLKGDKPIHNIPSRFVDLEPFKISKFPVTNTEFSRFIDHGGYTSEGLQRWWSPIGREVWNAYRAREEHPHMSQLRREDEPVNYPLFWSDQKYNHPAQPVVGVSWYEAEAYCNWLLSLMKEQDSSLWESKTISLPTDTQWDFAGGGIWEYAYPWEHRVKSPPTEKLANFRNKNGSPSVVGIFPEGSSWIGCHDMSGNVLEWCRSFYEDSSSVNQDRSDRSIRGGCFFDDDVERSIRISDRRGRKPAYRHSAIGFRLVVELFH